jgi:putative transcriptional regulator
MRHLLLYAVLLPLSAQKPGDLLVATAANRDPGFAGTVLLLIHCDSQSATALVLNRPLAGSARSQISGWTGAELPVYAGGPVAAGLNGLVPRGGCRQPAAGVCLENRREALEKLLPGSGARLYIGYTGWTRPQLDAEIRRGLWQVRRATPETVFTPAPKPKPPAVR